jgi:tetratricopeptide (TPR) repeat protein
MNPQDIIHTQTQLLEQSPHDLPALMARSLAHWQIGNYASAAADAEAAIEICGQAPELDPPLAAYVMRHQARIALSQNQTTRALEALEESAHFQNDHPDQILLEAEALRQAGHFSEALTQAQALPPEAWALDLQAQILTQMGQAEAALERQHQAITLDPDWAPAWFTRGQVYLQTGDLKAAQKDFRQALKLDKTLAAAYAYLAYLARMMGKADGAEDILEAGLFHDPDQLNLYYEAVRLYLSQGRQDEALEMLNHALEQHPDSLDLLALRDHLMN